MSVVRAMIPRGDQEDWRELIFALVYQHHGGSGMAISWSDALDMSFDEIEWYADRASAQRQKEAAAMRASSRKSK